MNIKMRKPLFNALASLLMITLCFGMLFGCAKPAPANQAVIPAPAAPQAEQMQPTLTEDEAKIAALTHAGVAEADAQFVRVKLDRDDGRMEYEVEFYMDSKEYDYEIDALTGAILSCDYDAEHYAVPVAVAPADATTTPTAQSAPGTTAAPSAQGQTNASLISENDAKKLALQHAGVKDADTTFLRVKLDYDDGVSEYDVEFATKAAKYEYEIDAVTGAIKKSDYEALPAAKQSNGDIGEAAAKKTALTHAGFAESDVNALRVKYDVDDGRAVYEVEFFVGTTEYSYEIDASNGSILEFDIDQDD